MRLGACCILLISTCGCGALAARSHAPAEPEGAHHFITNAGFARTAASDGRQIWLLSAARKSARLIDPATGQVQAQVPLPAPPVACTATSDWLWIVDQGGRLFRVDPQDGRVAAQRKLPAHENLMFRATSAIPRLDGGYPEWTKPIYTAPVSLGHASHGLWLSRYNRLWRLDPTSLEIIGEVELPLRSLEPAVLMQTTPDAVWVLRGSLGTIFRVDPNTLQVQKFAQMPPPRSPQFYTGLAVGEREIWGCESGGSICRVSRDSGAVEERLVLGRPDGGMHAWGVQLGHGSLWIGQLSTHGSIAYSPGEESIPRWLVSRFDLQDRRITQQVYADFQRQPFMFLSDQTLWLVDQRAARGYDLSRGLPPRDQLWRLAGTEAHYALPER